MGSTINGRKSRRGAALVLVAVSITALAGLGALAIDLGMLYKAHGDAQRAAEAGALAGASAFMEFGATDLQVVDEAKVRAQQYAKANSILNKPVAASEVPDTFVQVNPGSQTVRVTVERAAVETWFAKLLGKSAVLIRASAAATAGPAGGSNCVKPFAVPDTWRENTPGQDDGNQLEDGTETWSYTPGEDTYSPGNPDQPSAGTGYGGNLRDGGPDQYINDFGRPMSLRLPDPTSPTPQLGPRQFRPFSTNNSNANDLTKYREHIEECDPSALTLGTPYQLVDPNPLVPAATEQGVQALRDADPTAAWDDQTRSVKNSDPRYGSWRNSPRVVKVGFFDPGQLGPGQSTVTFNNIGLMFIEGFDPLTNSLNGRFFYFATGAGDPSSSAPAGTLVKRLRLVE